MASDWLLKKRKSNVQRNDFKQGFYVVRNKEKYIGTTAPNCMSSLEFRLCNYFDTNVNVIKWGSELYQIHYVNTLERFNGIYKQHIYYPDFYAEIKNNSGIIVKMIVEIKPSSQLLKPKEPKKKSAKSVKNYNYAINEFNRNMCKWKAAKAFCDRNSMVFKVLTEKDVC